MTKRRFVLLKYSSFILVLFLLTIVTSCDFFHTHSFSDEWSFDEKGHWHESTCSHFGIVSSYEEHVFDEGTIIIQPTHFEDGKKEYRCVVCGYTKEQIVEKTDHVFSTEWESNDTYHYHLSICGHPDIVSDYGEHNWVLEELILDNEIAFPGRYICKTCGYEAIKEICFNDVKIPIIDIQCDLSVIRKETKTRIIISYYSDGLQFETDATIKLQGSSSIKYPKKNYNIQLYQDDSFESKLKVELHKDWGKQSKYTLKANYVDYSQARNIIAGKIYGTIVKANNLSDGLETAPNGGVVDGFPVLVYNNGQYLGLFTLNIPKDEWMFGITSKKYPHSAIIMADNWNPPSYLTEPITNIDDVSENEEGMVLVFAGNEISNEAIIESFNAFTSELKKVSSKEDLLETIPYETINRAIDSMLFTYFVGACDNSAKNITWVSYDGKTWLPSIYDFDGSFGMHWSGTYFMDPEKSIVPSETQGNLLWTTLYRYCFDEICERYSELRKTNFTLDSVLSYFSDFLQSIHPAIIKNELIKWPDIPNNNVNPIEQVEDYMSKRIIFLDNIFGR